MSNDKDQRNEESKQLQNHIFEKTKSKDTKILLHYRSCGLWFFDLWKICRMVILRKQFKSHAHLLVNL